MQYTKRTCGFYIFTSRKRLMSNAPQLVQKLWNYCNILRDDGLSYGDYVEQLSALVTANLQRATRLRQSILQRPLEGKLLKEGK